MTETQSEAYRPEGPGNQGRIENRPAVPEGPEVGLPAGAARLGTVLARGAFTNADGASRLPLNRCTELPGACR